LPHLGQEAPPSSDTAQATKEAGRLVIEALAVRALIVVGISAIAKIVVALGPLTAATLPAGPYDAAW
jgi:hypothetical protein